MSTLGYKHTKETKEKIRLAHLGKKASEETKQKMSLSRMGNTNCLGYKASEETRKKLSKIHKGKDNYQLGRHHTEEAKFKMCTARQGRTPNLGKRLTEEWRKKIGLAEQGEKSHFWRGGVTPEIRKIRASFEYQTWRTAVYERDNYICQQCGIRGGTLHAHRVKLFRSHPELRFEISNGITLCKPCHNEFHKVTA